MSLGRWITAGVALIALMGCDDPGACVESVRVDSVKHGWCMEVDHPGQCPTFESGDEAGEYEWEFTPGKSCETQGYGFKCSESVYEDVESESECGERGG